MNKDDIFPVFCLIAFCVALTWFVMVLAVMPR
jgi:hypothetical protein